MNTNQGEGVSFIDALKSVAPSLQHRYFFPGHCGGLCAPAALVDLLSSSNSVAADGEDRNSVLSYDLPELDGLDNLHNPQVR